MTPRPANDDGNPSATIIVVVGVMIALGFILMLSYLLLGPLLLCIVVFGTAFAGFGALHYWWWGRSMTIERTDDVVSH